MGKRQKKGRGKEVERRRAHPLVIAANPPDADSHLVIAANPPDTGSRSAQRGRRSRGTLKLSNCDESISSKTKRAAGMCTCNRKSNDEVFASAAFSRTWMRAAARAFNSRGECH